MRKEYGVFIKDADEAAFSCGLFRCVEYSKGILDTPDALEIVERDVEKLIAYSRKYNVEVRSFHIPFGSSEYYRFEPASLDPAVRAETLALTKRLLKLVIPAGIRYVVLHGSLRVLPEERQQKLEVFVEYVQELCDFCKEYGITVAVETLKPRCIGNGLKEHLYIQEHVKRSNLGICFDSNHLLEEDNLDFLKGAGQYVVTTHFSDYDGIDERHWYPGRGINDWKQIVQILEEKGYREPYVFETSFHEEVNPRGAESYAQLIQEWEALFAE